VAGLVFERIILVRLRELAARTRAESDDVVSFGLRGAVVLWSVLAGIYWALQSVELDTRIERFVGDFLRINLIVSLTWVVMKIAVRLIGLYVRRTDGSLSSTTIFTNLTRILVVTIGGLIMLQAIGIPITPVLTTLGVGGIAVALALQDTLANLFAGVYILVSNKIRIGDQVRFASGEEGVVQDINWRNTAIKGPTGNLIIVPNATVASAVTTNFNLPSTELSVVANLGVSYESDLDQVERICLEVAREVLREVEGGAPEFEPLVRFNTFGDLRIGFSVIMRGQNFGSQFLLRHEFFKRIHRRFREEGIAFDPSLALRDSATPPKP
jgi:small-conductance mechanosensitive channel